MKLEEGQTLVTLYISEDVKKEPDPLIRLCILGPGAVGKSALTMRYTSNIFADDYDPTIEDAYRKQKEVDGKLATLDILDTAGQEDYNALRAAWYRRKDGFILVFAIDKANTLDELTKFHDQITDFYTDYYDQEKVPPILVVGNKADLEATPNLWERAQEHVKDRETIGLLKTSAKSGLNVHMAFANTVRAIRRRRNALAK